MKKILCVVSAAPYAGTRSTELIEAALVGAVFDFSVSVLFRDEGVWSLVEGQEGETIGRKTVGKLLGALPTYDIEHVYVCEDSLTRRGLNNSRLVGSPQPVTFSDQAVLMSEQDAVLGASR